jgi:hypothetical protein
MTMHDQDNGSPHVRWVLFAVATVALAATLVTCKSVTDNALAPREPATLAANCISECAHAANDAMRDESELHVANEHACDKGDPKCHQAEAVRHQAAVDRIQDQRKACQNNCHHQGGGKGH